MDDRLLVTRLLEIGVAARRISPDGYAKPSDESDLKSISVARIANWLENLGRHRLIGDVQACISGSGAGFRFQATDEAVRLFADASGFDEWLDFICPLVRVFHLFISYATGDSAIAHELLNDLEKSGLKCFMAEKDIQVATEWQDSIRAAMSGSKRILVLLTPRSINRPWVLMETGAAWALGKPLIPALSHVAANDLLDPVRRYQARVIETTAQRQSLVNELTKQILGGDEVLLTQSNKHMAGTETASERKISASTELKIRSIKGHRVLTPMISQGELAEEMFERS